MTYVVCYKGPDAEYTNPVASWQEGFDTVNGLIDALRPPRSYNSLVGVLHSKMTRQDLPFYMTDGTHIFVLERTDA
jgi:hypothetical protein